MAGKLMNLKRAGTCAGCSADLPVGTSAYWVAAERVVRCVECGADTTVVTPVLPEATVPSRPAAPIVDRDVAGGSALHEYERRSTRERAKKEQRLAEDAEWRATIKGNRPVLGRLAAAMTPRPVITPESQSTKAWEVGAEGEERVAEVMANATGVDVLHDRRVPGSRANIDHIVVGPQGVFVVDAKKYSGAVEVRDRGGLFRVDEQLYVNGRNCSKLVDGVLGQMDVVRTALADAVPEVPVRGVLCFIGGEWGWRMRPKVVKGVTSLWPVALPDHVCAAGPHANDVAAIAAHLRTRLRPAT